MARSLNRLPPRAAATTTRPGMHADGGGLYLRVTKAGSRQWVFVYQWRKKRRELGLGGALKVTLAKARERAQEARDLLADGRDPIMEAKAERALPTFGEVADKWIADRESSVRNTKSVDRWKRVLGETGYSRALRDLRIDAVGTDEVLGVLNPIWAKGATATLARGYIEAVLDAASARRLRSGANPARWKGHLEHLLAKPAKLARGHHEAMAYTDLPRFMAVLRSKASTVALALEFTILTAVRSGEALGARCGEIDRASRLWTIPAARMKAGKAHAVPLSDRAMEIVEKLWPEDAGQDSLLFTNGAKALSVMACPMMLRRMDLTATVHGFRSTFRDWAGDVTDYPRDLLETALAHSLGSVEAAYRRATALEKRRDLMRDWAAYCGKIEILRPATGGQCEPEQRSVAS